MRRFRNAGNELVQKDDLVLPLVDVCCHVHVAAIWVIQKVVGQHAIVGLTLSAKHQTRSTRLLTAKKARGRVWVEM